MTATAIDVFANPVSSRRVVSVNPFAPVTKPTSTESANATTEFLFTKENALSPSSALSTVSSISLQTAASASLASQSSEESAPAINIVE
jgi:hypothetical protein